MHQAGGRGDAAMLLAFEHRLRESLGFSKAGLMLLLLRHHHLSNEKRRLKFAGDLAASCSIMASLARTFCALALGQLRWWAS